MKSARLLALVSALAALPFTTGAGQPGTQAPRESSHADAVTDSVLDARTRELSAQLRCPVCQGLSLADSPSELSQQMKDVVRAQLAEGKTEREVKAFFVARYGEWILMSPPAHGFNVLVYALPLAGLAVGASALVLLVRRWSRPTGSVPDR